MQRTYLWRLATIALLIAIAIPLTFTLASQAHAAQQSGTLSVAPASQVTLSAVTVNAAKLRTGPGTGYASITVIPYNVTLTTTGRNADSSWIFVSYNGQPGWVYATLLKFQGGNPSDLPVVDTIVPGGSPVPTPTPAGPSGPVTVTTKNTLRMRMGPGTNYGQVGLIPAKVTLTPTGRNTSGQWVFVEYNGARGWSAAWLTTVSGNIMSLPITNETGSGGGGGGTPTTGSFELGGQTHSLNAPGEMQRARMVWVKFQHKWTPGQDPSVVADRINLAHSKGFKVLLSIAGPLYPTSTIDYAAYSTFVAGVARQGADAIEVWNEQNFSREWPVGQINPATYVNKMLAPSYRAIKAANPGTMVISGALGPTGWHDGVSIWADDVYLRGMANAGAASYMDCLGIHYNAGATSPDATSGHPADPGPKHYSWYFKPMMNLYTSVFPTRKLCFTEIGYLSPEGYGPLPEGFWWGVNTSVSEQADWLARAVTLSRQSSKVRMFIVFNVDLTLWDSTDPQAGYAIIRPGGECPACDTLANAMK